jgi:hypothetical protein
MISENQLLQDVEYKIEETSFGTWRKYLYPSGELFEEFKSSDDLFGLPLVHYTRGRCPETGKRIVAKGIIAVGRLAVGVVAIGQASLGIVAVGQLGLGLLFGLGQACSGVVGIGQFALGGLFGLGQFATGYVAIAQVGFGHYVLSQIGVGSHVIDMRGVSPVAKQFFQQFIP